MCKGTFPRFQEPLQLGVVGCAGRYFEVVADVQSMQLFTYHMRKKRDVTYDYHRRAERSVHKEVARLRETGRLALKPATILVAEVWIEKDRKLGLRD
jgi:hypothetical protein